MRRERIYTPDENREAGGNVVYWMSRDQRVHDNWAMVHGLELAEKTKSRFFVVFALVSGFMEATIRQYDFMLNGLKEVEAELRDRGIPFYLLQGDPGSVLVRFADEHDIGTIVTDFDPLKIKRKWKKEVHDAGLHLIEVDAHNIVPARFVSNKTEYGAYTLRPKIHRHLENFLDEFPDIQPPEKTGPLPPATDWNRVRSSLKVDHSVAPVDWLGSGQAAAREMLEDFLQHRLNGYAEKRNDPNENMTSNLSPYLHFGQISAQRVALDILRKLPRSPDTDAFLEELIVRRELSDNFCLYNPDYDNPDGFHEWARKTHSQHAADEREYIYNLESFEKAQTQDPLWNAAQHEMVRTGKMHGYMRMYWAKKIFEWTPDVAEAMRIAIYLNDKYELDGRDPNGYAGIAWSVGGVHDRAWQERPVFGKIRYMNYNGCKRKFNVKTYIEKTARL